MQKIYQRIKMILANDSNKFIREKLKQRYIKLDAYQLNKTIQNGAKFNAKPELEIYAR